MEEQITEATTEELITNDTTKYEDALRVALDAVSTYQTY